MILSVQKLHKHFNGIVAVDRVSFEIPAGQVCALIGPNGAGKTTLFNLVTGYLKPDDGWVKWKEKPINGGDPYLIARMGIGRTFQDLRLIMKLSVLESVILAFPNQKGEDIFGALLGRGREARRKHRARAMEILEFVGIAEKANQLAEELSYGQQKLLSLACCLALGANLLLLDEPVAGVNPALIEKILKLIQDLQQQSKTVLLIEHNMDAVMNVSDRIIAMDEGRIIADGRPIQVRENPNVVESYLS